MNKELAEAVKLFISQPLNNPLSRGQIMEVARIALPILEQHEQGEDWIEWSGGAMPTSTPFQEVGYLTRLGNKDKSSAGDLRWAHEGKGGDIIAYRIIPEQPTNQKGEAL